MPKCRFPSPPEVPAPLPPTFFGAPLGHPNSLKIAPARALCAKVRARAPLNAKSRTFGGPRVPQGAKMEPKWKQMDTQNAPKIEASQEKCRTWFGPYYLLYILTIGTLRKPHFLTPRSKQNAGLFRMVPRMPPRSCKMTPTGPKNGESGLSRGSQGCQRVPPMPPKMLQKSSKISTPLQDCLQGCFWGASGSPPAPKCVHF